MIMNIKPTFNRCTKTRYRPAVAKVYGTVRGVPFQQVFKSMEAATRTAVQYNGFVVNLIH
ncbi:MAG: hypothetical protein AABY01_03020 [Nanoarchaeota archaeon]